MYNYKETVSNKFSNKKETENNVKCENVILYGHTELKYCF